MTDDWYIQPNFSAPKNRSKRTKIESTIFFQSSKLIATLNFGSLVLIPMQCILLNTKVQLVTPLSCFLLWHIMNLACWNLNERFEHSKHECYLILHLFGYICLFKIFSNYLSISNIKKLSIIFSSCILALIIFINATNGEYKQRFNFSEDSFVNLL